MKLIKIVFKKFLFVVVWLALFLRDKVSLYNPDWPKTLYADQAGLRLSEMHLPPPTESWDLRGVLRRIWIFLSFKCFLLHVCVCAHLPWRMRDGQRADSRSQSSPAA